MSFWGIASSRPGRGAEAARPSRAPRRDQDQHQDWTRGAMPVGPEQSRSSRRSGDRSRQASRAARSRSDCLSTGTPARNRATTSRSGVRAQLLALARRRAGRASPASAVATRPPAHARSRLRRPCGQLRPGDGAPVGGVAGPHQRGRLSSSAIEQAHEVARVDPQRRVPAPAGTPGRTARKLVEAPRTRCVRGSPARPGARVPGGWPAPPGRACTTAAPARYPGRGGGSADARRTAGHGAHQVTGDHVSGYVMMKDQIVLVANDCRHKLPA